MFVLLICEYKTSVLGSISDLKIPRFWFIYNAVTFIENYDPSCLLVAVSRSGPPCFHSFRFIQESTFSILWGVSNPVSQLEEETFNHESAGIPII